MTNLEKARKVQNETIAQGELLRGMTLSDHDAILYLVKTIDNNIAVLEYILKELEQQQVNK